MYHPATPDYVGELALIEMSRMQRKVMEMSEFKVTEEPKDEPDVAPRPKKEKKTIVAKPT